MPHNNKPEQADPSHADPVLVKFDNRPLLLSQKQIRQAQHEAEARANDYALRPLTTRDIDKANNFDAVIVNEYAQLRLVTDVQL